jgi:hypothetical protein
VRMKRGKVVRDQKKLYLAEGGIRTPINRSAAGHIAALTPRHLTLSTCFSFIRFTLGFFLFLPEEKNAWAHRDSNSGPLPREGNVITTRPWALILLLLFI